MPPRIGVHRYIASGTLAALHLALAYAYAVGLTGQPPPTPGRVSVVLFIDSLGPTWRIAFGLTGLFLLLCLRITRWLPYAHSLAAVPAATYAAALWLGFAFSEPPRPSVVTALLATAITIWHPTIGVAYSRLVAVSHEPPLRPRGRRQYRRGKAV